MAALAFVRCSDSARWQRRRGRAPCHCPPVPVKPSYAGLPGVALGRFAGTTVVSEDTGACIATSMLFLHCSKLLQCSKRVSSPGWCINPL